MEGVTCLLDTSIFIEYFRKRDKSNTVLVQRFAGPGPAMSAITLMELEFGEQSPDHADFLMGLLERYPVLPFDTEAAQRAGYIFRILKKENQIIGVRDLMIAAVALVPV